MAQCLIKTFCALTNNAALNKTLAQAPGCKPRSRQVASSLPTLSALRAPHPHHAQARARACGKRDADAHRRTVEVTRRAVGAPDIPPDPLALLLAPTGRVGAARTIDPRWHFPPDYFKVPVTVSIIKLPRGTCTKVAEKREKNHGMRSSAKKPRGERGEGPCPGRRGLWSALRARARRANCGAASSTGDFLASRMSAAIRGLGGEVNAALGSTLSERAGELLLLAARPTLPVGRDAARTRSRGPTVAPGAAGGGERPRSTAACASPSRSRRSSCAAAARSSAATRGLRGLSTGTVAGHSISTLSFFVTTRCTEFGLDSGEMLGGRDVRYRQRC